MRDPETSEQPREPRDPNPREYSRTPFDTSDLNDIPRTTDEDPPYRNWWVVIEPDSR